MISFHRCMDFSTIKFQHFSAGVLIPSFCSLMSCLIFKHKVLDIYIRIILIFIELFCGELDIYSSQTIDFFIRIPIQSCLHPHRICLNLYLDSTLLDESLIYIVYFLPILLHILLPIFFPIFFHSSPYLFFFLSYILIVHLQIPSTSSPSSFIFWNKVIYKSATIKGLVLFDLHSIIWDLMQEWQHNLKYSSLYLCIQMKIQYRSILIVREISWITEIWSIPLWICAFKRRFSIEVCLFCVELSGEQRGGFGVVNWVESMIGDLSWSKL